MSQQVGNNRFGKEYKQEEVVIISLNEVFENGKIRVNAKRKTQKGKISSEENGF